MPMCKKCALALNPLTVSIFCILLFGFLIPSYMALPLYVTILGIAVLKRRRLGKAIPYIAILVSLRIVGSCWTIHVSHHIPFPVDSQRSVLLSGYGLGCLAYGDIGTIEASVRARYLLILRNGNAPPRFFPDLDYSTIDPFSGNEYARAHSGVRYSLGPDAIDQFGALAYDPTNGTFSPGDIIINKM